MSSLFEINPINTIILFIISLFYVVAILFHTDSFSFHLVSRSRRQSADETPAVAPKKTRSKTKNIDESGE